MAADEGPSAHEVRALARLAGLDLPDDRVDQLVDSLGRLRPRLAGIYEIELGASEPPTPSFHGELRR